MVACGPIFGGLTLSAGSMRCLLLMCCASVLLPSEAVHPSGESLQPTSDHHLSAISKEEKQASLNAAVERDNKVIELERHREDTWVQSRKKLMMATSPAIRAENVLALLSEETNRFSAIEEQIKIAKSEQDHMRKVADMASAAWSAQEQSRLLGRKAKETAEEAARQEKAAQAARAAQALAVTMLAKERREASA